jgi:hypothetical protein
LSIARVRVPSHAPRGAISVPIPRGMDSGCWVCDSSARSEVRVICPWVFCGGLGIKGGCSDSTAGLIRTVVLPSLKFSSSSGSKRAISPFGDGWYRTLSFPSLTCRSKVRVVTPKYSAASFLPNIF